MWITSTRPAKSSCGSAQRASSSQIQRLVRSRFWICGIDAAAQIPLDLKAQKPSLRIGGRPAKQELPRSKPNLNLQRTLLPVRFLRVPFLVQERIQPRPLFLANVDQTKIRLLFRNGTPPYVARPAVRITANQPAPFIIPINRFLLPGEIDVKLAPADAWFAFHSVEACRQ